jgi:hypothetical protein
VPGPQPRSQDAAWLADTIEQEILSPASEDCARRAQQRYTALVELRTALDNAATAIGPRRPPTIATRADAFVVLAAAMPAFRPQVLAAIEQARSMKNLSFWVEPDPASRGRKKRGTTATRVLRHIAGMPPAAIARAELRAKLHAEPSAPDVRKRAQAVRATIRRAR